MIHLIKIEFIKQHHYFKEEEIFFLETKFFRTLSLFNLFLNNLFTVIFLMLNWFMTIFKNGKIDVIFSNN